MQDSTTSLLALTHSSLRAIGYRDDLLRDRYPFADVLIDTSPRRQIDLAAFAQEPPSYRSACFGVTILEQPSPEKLLPYRALGAPQIFTLSPAQNTAHRWRMTASGEPVFIEQIAAEHLRSAFEAHRDEWSPAAILRAKAVSFERAPAQLDFFDTGLLPTLEGMAHQKLDSLLRDVLATSKAIYAEHHDGEPDYEALFRLIFRFVAAKMLADRGFPGDHWLDPDPQRVITAVDSFYFQQAPDESLLQDRNVQRAAWDKIRSAFLFQNLSVEALAYVYENTLVSERSRQVLDTHATPPQIAEYIVRQLPFEDLPHEERRAFEPFSGHAPFLIAALGRLRALLPPDMSPADRHRYFVQMLSGMEIDAFAREVARYSLILADYPNPDGWDIAQGDVFTSSQTNDYLRRAQIVLCNPPFSNSQTRKKGDQTGKRAVMALSRMLEHPPRQLGFVLPKVFVSGQEYRTARQRLAETYQQIDVLALPDTVFYYADTETVLLTAHGARADQPRRSVAAVSKPDYEQFLQTGAITWREQLTADLVDIKGYPVFWRTPLWRVWDSLSHLRRLGDVAEVHRGIEYRLPLRSHEQELISDQPRSGFVAGLVSVQEGFEPFITNASNFLNTDPELMLYEAYKLPWDKPKVIVNAARRSRGSWRLTAVVDRQGLVCYQRFHGIWPRAELPLEVIAAILNSPVANGFLNAHPAAADRDNQIRAVREIPFPNLTQSQTQAIITLVQQYQAYRAQWREHPERTEELEAACRDTLAQIDAEVLAAYDLPPRLEKLLLDSFAGQRRPGSVDFTGYYPPGFRPAIPWRIYISEEFRASSARETIARLPVINDPVITAALRNLEDESNDDDIDTDN